MAIELRLLLRSTFYGSLVFGRRLRFHSLEFRDSVGQVILETVRHRRRIDQPGLRLLLIIGQPSRPVHQVRGVPFLCLLAQHRRVDEPVLQERVRHDRLRQACFGFLLTLRLSRRGLGQLRRVLVSGELTLVGFGNPFCRAARDRVRELDIACR
jgi:hypothetical protein